MSGPVSVDINEWGAYTGPGRQHFFNVNRAFSTLHLNAQDLVTLLVNANSDPLSWHRLVGDFDDEESVAYRDRFEKLLDQRLLNVLASAGSYVDLRRRLLEHHSPVAVFVQESEERNDRVTALPEAKFLRGLRNYALHYSNLPVAHSLSLDPQAAPGATIHLSGSALLEWGGWNATQRAYIAAVEPDGGPNVQQIVVLYFEAMAEYHRWLMEQYRVLHVAGKPPAHLVRQPPSGMPHE